MFMEAEETRAAEALAMRATRADRVGRLGLSVRAVRVEAAPVYVPAYVFRSTHFGAKLRTFVSGAPVTRAAVPACCTWPACGCGRQCLQPLHSSAFAAAFHPYVASAARYELGQPGAARSAQARAFDVSMVCMYVQGSGWQDALPAGAGVSGAAVGVRVYDESKVALAAGALGAAAVAATGALGGLASWAALGWCVALPMVLAGSFAHWLPKLRGDVATYWQRMQRQRRAFAHACRMRAGLACVGSLKGGRLHASTCSQLGAALHRCLLRCRGAGQERAVYERAAKACRQLQQTGGTVLARAYVCTLAA